MCHVWSLWVLSKAWTYEENICGYLSKIWVSSGNRFVGVSGSILLLTLEIGGEDAGERGEHISGLLGGLPELSLECSEQDGLSTGDPLNCGEDFEEDEYDGEGDLLILLEGDTDIGDKVLDVEKLEEVSIPMLFCSENRLAEKNPGFVCLYEGEFGGTGGFGNCAGLERL